MNRLFAELRRRNVFRVAGVYAVTSWLLVQVAVALEAALSLPKWFDGAIVGFLLIGFPIAMILAWAFELTPEGMKLTANVPEGDSIAPKTGRKLDYAILAGIGLIAVMFAVDRMTPRSPTIAASGAAGGPIVKTVSAPGDASVAVLPFDNRSAREEDAYFAEGMHDDLLTQLSKVSALRVISRTSVLGYKGTAKKIPEIAEELGVAVILEGAVQRAGDRVRINVQLIDGATDSHLWAENYDRQLTTENVFDIQAEIAGVIAAALKTALKVDEKAALGAGSTTSVAAYEAFLRGNLLSRYETRTAESLRAAVGEFESAARLDPAFAAAFAAEAQAELSLYWTYADETALKAARRTLDKAEALAPDAPETLISLAYYHYWGFFDYARADAILDQALERTPSSADAWQAKAFIARRDGRFADAVAAFEQARRFDPLHYEATIEFSGTLAVLGEFARARELRERAVAISPNALSNAYYEAEYWTLRGDPQRAWAAAKESRDSFDYRFLQAVNSRDPEIIAFALETWPLADRRLPRSREAYELARAEALLTAGRKADAAIVLAEIEARLRSAGDLGAENWNAQSAFFAADLPGLNADLQGVRAAELEYRENAPKDAWVGRDRQLGFAKAFVRAGDRDAALGYLERIAASFGPASYLQFSIIPAFDPLRSDKRYLALKASYETWAAEHRDE